ncbi:MAG: hypothetical protein ABIJ83_03290 [Patescibacteria group bacterium]
MLKNVKFLLTTMWISALIFGSSPVLAQFDPSFILSDYELTNYSSMDMGQIQNFLTSKNSKLSTYVDPSIRITASQIIYDSARLHKINPKYILVLLQKEQSLVEDGTPNQDQYDWATGYGICDGCKKTDSKVQKYKGFPSQIDWGAGGTRYYLDNANEFKYQVGETYVIDNTNVTIKNDATRALFTYTPHLHGNQNLYNIWQTWFLTSYLNGSLLQNKEDGGIWLIRDGKKHPFLSKSAFLSRYSSFDLVIPAEPADLDKYPSGYPIEYPNYSLLQIPTGGIYLLDDDTLRPIESKEIFKLLGFNPEEVVSVESKDIFPYKIGGSISSKSAYPTGALLQDKATGGVYYVQNGIKRPIIARSFLKNYYSSKTIIPVFLEELAKYQTGDVVMLRDGELVVGELSPTVYFISDGLKRPFGSEADFLGIGYKFSNVLRVEDKVLALHDDGDVIEINN